VHVVGLPGDATAHRSLRREPGVDVHRSCDHYADEPYHTDVR
jgi:hypothetical protein